MNWCLACCLNVRLIDNINVKQWHMIRIDKTLTIDIYLILIRLNDVVLAFNSLVCAAR